MDKKISYAVSRWNKKNGLTKLIYWINHTPVLMGAWLILIGVLLKIGVRRDFVEALIVAMGMHVVITELLLKRGVLRGLRKRPHVEFLDWFEVSVRSKTTSFPSGHMSGLVSFLWVVNAFYPGWEGVSLGLVVLMGFFRIFLGAHYLSDLVVGVALGVIYGMVAVWGVRL